MPTERSPNKLGSDVGDKDGDKKRRGRLQDASHHEAPLALEAKAKFNDASNLSNRQASELGERTKRSDPATVPRSQMYFQHDDRGTASQDGRRSGRRVTSERGSWNSSSREEERGTHKTRGPPDAPEKNNGKSLARGGGGENHHVWRHDRFSEVEGDGHPPPPATKKRRQFREEKLPRETEPTAENNNKAPPAASSDLSKPAATHIESQREEKAPRERRPLERSSEYDRGAYARERERERSFSNRGRVEKAGFPPTPRERFGGGGGGDNGGRYSSRGKDGGFGGWRGGGYQRSSGGGRVEKWKHDMFDEANRSPTHKNVEEDPVAKVEALLAL